MVFVFKASSLGWGFARGYLWAVEDITDPFPLTVCLNECLRTYRELGYMPCYLSYPALVPETDLHNLRLP